MRIITKIVKSPIFVLFSQLNQLIFYNFMDSYHYCFKLYYIHQILCNAHLGLLLMKCQCLIDPKKVDSDILIHTYNF
jgi:hypothetical protein